MTRTKFWSRYIYQPTFNAAFHATADVVGTLQPGETLLRSIITQDTWLQSTTAPFLDAGQRAAWGLIPGTSNTTPPFLPLDGFSQDNIRWLYNDQIIFHTDYVQPASAGRMYVARNSERNQYTDSHIQYAVPGNTTQYLWLCQQFDAPITANSTVISSASASFLILGPPS